MLFDLLVNFFSSNTFIDVTIKGVFPNSGVAKIYYVKMTHDFGKGLAVDINIEGSAQEQTIGIQLNNRIVHKLKLDFSLLSSTSLIAHPAPQKIIINEVALISFSKQNQ